MLGVLQNIINKYTRAFVPPIVHGASSMIKQLAEEEEKIIRMNEEHIVRKKHITRPREDISDILSKYVSKDINKEAYKFIKLNQDCNAT